MEGSREEKGQNDRCLNSQRNPRKENNETPAKKFEKGKTKFLLSLLRKGSCLEKQVLSPVIHR